MTYPVIIQEKFVYCRLQGFVWKYNRTIEPNLLQESAGTQLSDAYCNIKTDDPFVVNCSHVTKIDGHALERLHNSILKTKRTIIFTCVDDNFETEIRKELKSPSCFYQMEPSHRLLCYGQCQFELDYAKEILSGSNDLEKSTILKYVKSCYRESAERLESTPLKTNGVFDAREIISDPNKFAWVCLLLSDKLLSYLEQKKLVSNFSIMAVSLRGSPFAAGVALLTRSQHTLEIIDHMGPRHQILEDLPHKFSAPPKIFIYIGDFMVGGTEVKIADTYARSKGAKVICALLIGSLLDSKEFQTNIDIDRLVSLRDCQVNLSYSI